MFFIHFNLNMIQLFLMQTEGGITHGIRQELQKKKKPLPCSYWAIELNLDVFNIITAELNLLHEHD